MLLKNFNKQLNKIFSFGSKHTVLRVFSSQIPKGEDFYKKLREGVFNDKNPVEVININKNQVDLRSYDMLFDRFINGEWGATKPRSPTQIA